MTEAILKVGKTELGINIMYYLVPHYISFIDVEEKMAFFNTSYKLHLDLDC